HEQVAVTSHQKRWDANALHAPVKCKVLHEMETVRHDALVRVPALARDKVKERVLLLFAAEEQIKELIHEGIVSGQWITGHDGPSDLVQQAALESRPGALDGELAKPMGIANGKLQGEDSAERDAQYRRPFQIVPFEKLGQ